MGKFIYLKPLSLLPKSNLSVSHISELKYIKYDLFEKENSCSRTLQCQIVNN